MHASMTELLENVKHGLVWVGANGTVRFANRSGQSFTGLAPGAAVADGALAPMSGLTSQPNLNSLVEALRQAPRATGVDTEKLKSLAYYWEAVREFYAPFETGMKAGDVDIYLHEMPGGQYANLYVQAKSLGLGDRWAGREIWMPDDVDDKERAGRKRHGLTVTEPA